MFNFSSLRFKLFTLISILFIILISFNFYINITNIKEHNYSYLKSSNETISTLVSNCIYTYIKDKNYKKIKKIIYSIENPYIKNIYILNENAEILLDKTATAPQHKKYKYFKQLKNNKLTNENHNLIIKTFTLSGKIFAYMITEGNIQQCKIDITKEINIQILHTILYLFLSLISSYFISKSMIEPLEKIINKIKLTNPNESIKFDISAQKEYQYLSDIISQKHNSLHKLNMNLEKEILDKNMDLQQLNASLEGKIAEAINNLEQKEKLLQHQSRHAQIGEMISMIAHQWKQPLSAIAASTYALAIKAKRKTFDLSTKDAQDAHFENLEKNLDEIQKHIKDLSQTTENFRSFFKPEVSKQRCLINDTVEQALQIIKSPMQNSNINISTKLNSVQYIELFKNEITQVILNILRNAQDNFQKNNISNAMILIKSYDQEKSIILEISDNGTGIEKENINKIFDPYFSTKTDKNGAGLSLYIAKIIVHEHNNGTLRVENRDNGATFIMTFNL